MINWKRAEIDTPPLGHVLIRINEDDDLISIGSYEVTHHGPAWRIGNDNIGWDYDWNKDAMTHDIEWSEIPI